MALEMRALGFMLAIVVLFSRCRIIHAMSMACSTAKSYGYECIDYNVVTGDGYVLSLQRIYSGNGKVLHNTIIRTQPVLLQHGLFNDGYTWISGQRDQSLALALADEGYDVWLANARGTRTSREHIHLNAKESAYWQWSWDELTRYDLTANVDLIYNETQQSMHYVGHSLGTTTVMASFSLNSMENKLRSIGMLCPIEYLNHARSEIVDLLAQFQGDELLQLLGVAEFLPGSEAAGKLASALCSTYPELNMECGDLISLFTGNNCCVDPSIVNKFLKTTVQSTSTMNLAHMAQMMRDGTFSMYDYSDPFLNTNKYGQPKPPAYQISNIPPTLPIFFSYGTSDALSNVIDAQLLLAELKDSYQQDKLVVHSVPGYAHMDFIVARDVKTRVYDPLISFIKNI